MPVQIFWASPKFECHKGGVSNDFCLVLLQVPKCFVPVQIFWASPKLWLHLVPLQKLLYRHKNQFYWMQIIFLSGTKCLWLPQYVNRFLEWHKKFWPAQNILGPVKRQGINELSIFSSRFPHLCRSLDVSSEYEVYQLFRQLLKEAVYILKMCKQFDISNYSWYIAFKKENNYKYKYWNKQDPKHFSPQRLCTKSTQKDHLPTRTTRRFIAQ